MLRRRHLQAVAGTAIVVIGLGASSLVASASSSATKVVNAVAMPAFNLDNGQTTWVQGSGYPKNTSVALVECNSSVATKGQSACDLGTLVITKSTSTGRLPAHAFKVVTGVVGSGAAKGRCDPAHSCFIVAATLDQSTAGLAPIHFG